MNTRANRQRMEALRALIAEKFPETPAAPLRRRKIGCRRIDEDRGGLREGAVTEICGSSGGARLLLGAILDAAVRESFPVALVDGADAFHPDDWTRDQLGRVLWVRCENAKDAVKAMDLLVRDGNLPVLVLDLQGMQPRDWRKIPASTWHRFHRLVEQTACVLAVLTPRPMVEGAPSRIAVEFPNAFKGRVGDRRELLEQLQLRIFERGEGVVEPGLRQSA